MSETDNKLNYAVEQRIRFIDFLLQRYGHLGRNELAAFFGISQPQATRDFRVYKQLAPGNLVFDVTNKRYVKAVEFKPLYNHTLGE